MICERCKKPETSVSILHISCNAWKPLYQLCQNCIAWFQAYNYRFMKNDLSMNALMQQKTEELERYLNNRGVITIPYTPSELQEKLVDAIKKFVEVREYVKSWMNAEGRLCNLRRNVDCPRWTEYEKAEEEIWKLINKVGAE